MNTTEKGDNFEERVFNYLLKLLNKGELLVNPKTSRIFKKKPYFSRDRNANIIVDISIEVAYNSDSSIGMIMLIECKDTKHSISVDDIEEFHSKLQQITGANVKAIFATTASLQKSAFEYAKAKGIGVIRFMPDDQVSLVAYQLSGIPKKTDINLRRQQILENAILNQNYQAENQQIFSFTGMKTHSNWIEVFTMHLKEFRYEEKKPVGFWNKFWCALNKKP